MKEIEVGTSHVTPAGRNIFLDLGFEPQEAKKLLEETQRKVAEKLAANISTPEDSAAKPI